MLSNYVRLMGGIKRYAANLNAIVTADTAERVGESVDKTLASVQSMAASLDEAAGSGARAAKVAAFTDPLTRTTDFLVGSYVRKLQLNALRHATAQADPVMRDVHPPRRARSAEGCPNGPDEQPTIPVRAPACPNESRAGQPLHQALVVNLDAAEAAYDDLQGQEAPNRIAKLQAWARAAETLDEALRLEPGGVFVKMAGAHAALTKALNDPDVTFLQALARIEDFTGEVRKLNEVIESFEAAREQAE